MRIKDSGMREKIGCIMKKCALSCYAAILFYMTSFNICRVVLCFSHAVQRFGHALQCFDGAYGVSLLSVASSTDFLFAKYYRPRKLAPIGAASPRVLGGYSGKWEMVDLKYESVSSEKKKGKRKTLLISQGRVQLVCFVKVNL